MPHLAFLGHSSTDKGVVSQIASGLKARGIQYWLDSEQIVGGDDIVKRIGEGLKASTAFVAFIGAEGEEGKWQGIEINTAIVKSTGDNKSLIPVLIDGATPDIVPTLLRRLHALTFPSADDETALDELSEAIRRTDTGPVNGTAPDVPPAVPYAYESFFQNFLSIARETDVNFLIGPAAWTPATDWTEVARHLIVDRAGLPNSGDWFHPAALSPPVELAAMLFALKRLNKDVAACELNTVLKRLESKEALSSARSLAKAVGKMKARRSSSSELGQVLLTTNHDLAIERAMLIEGLSFTRIVQDIVRRRLIVEEYVCGVREYTKGKDRFKIDRPVTAEQADRLLAEREGREFWYCSAPKVPPAVGGMVGDLEFVKRQSPVLYKFKGSVDVPGSCVVSTDDLLECVSRASALVPSQITLSLNTQVPLFLGYYLSDVDLRLLRKTALQDLPGGEGLTKFALSPQPEAGPKDKPWGQEDIRTKLGPTLQDRLSSDGYQTTFADVSKFLARLVEEF